MCERKHLLKGGSRLHASSGMLLMTYSANCLTTPEKSIYGSQYIFRRIDKRLFSMHLVL
jgi:hypothetical protein